MNDLSGLLLLSLRFGLAIVLYAFLGWSILILWREFRQLAHSMRDQQIPNIHLSTKRSPDQPDQMKFNFPQIIIGRDPACDYYLDNETVSSKHIRLYYQRNQWWVEDLDSSNGTFLNDQPVIIPTVLTENDKLRCGQVEIKIAFSN
jgi:pSer/pThr/pTyr-binding forkhead associated (FHA) protein